ncbi:MAG: energy transducer TonB, partial [Thiohalocapsa sp.]
SGTGNRPMLLALTGACLLHTLLLFGVGFELPEPNVADRSNIEIMLITQAAPITDALDPASINAQADRAGETLLPLPELEDPLPDPIIDDAAELAPQTAEPIQPLLEAPPEELEVAPPPEPEPLPEPQSEPTPEPEAEPEAEPEPEPEPEPAPDPQPPDMLSADDSPMALESAPPITAADILASRGAEIARLTERINAKTRAYQSRARRKAISTSTREYRYAAYMEAWRRKVERIGNLNYPEEARRQGLYGNLLLHVSVRADGSLEGIRVVRSSGQEVLDQAAMRIVELAAPFAPFPPDIAAETDLLDITRTWQFQRNNQLGWDN